MKLSSLSVFVLSIAAATYLSSCKKEKENNINSPTCDNSQPPLVMVHGALASGDTYASQFMRFSANGFCEDRMFVFDWNTVGSDGQDTTRLRLFIDSILALTNSKQVVLMGHSAGGTLSYRFCSDSSRAAKVAKYIHIGSSPQTVKAGNGTIPTLNIWSPGDKVVSGADNPQAENAKLDNKDHYEVATCAEAFVAMYKFITGKNPSFTDIRPAATRKVGGRVVTLGENTPIINASIKVYEVDNTSGERKQSSPSFTFTSDNKGNWGPFEAKSNTYYEFEVNTGKAGDRVVHYYREPFVRNNPLVYLRTFPSGSSTVGALLSSIPKDDAQSVYVVFSANKAVISGRDILRVDTAEISIPKFAADNATTIAFFLYDGNNNKQSDISSMGFFGSFPFLEAVDVFLNPENNQKTLFEFNGRKYKVPNWKSNSDGVGIVVFD